MWSCFKYIALNICYQNIFTLLPLYPAPNKNDYENHL